MKWKGVLCSVGNSTCLLGKNGFIFDIACGRCNPADTCFICRFYRSRPGSDICWKGTFLVLGKKSLVSHFASCRYRNSCCSIMVRCNLPTHCLGDGIAFKGWRYRLFRYFHIVLATKTFVLSSSGVGIRSRLYRHGPGRCCELDLGSAAFV